MSNTESSKDQITTTSNNTEENNQQFSKYAHAAFLIIGNICSSVGLILVNKYLVQNMGLHYVLLLTTLHFLLPTVLLFVVNLCVSDGTQQQAVSIPTNHKLAVAALNVGSIAFMNLSLQFNSVGFYQITKLMCIPCIVVLQLVLYMEFISYRTKLSLVALLAGVGVVTITDVKLQWLGFTYGLLAIFFTSLSQLLVGKVQSKYQLQPFQLFSILMLPQTVIMFIWAVLVEVVYPVHVEPSSIVLSYSLVGMVLASCTLAMGVNYFTYAIIGKTSAITLQVIGHLKTCLIISLGYFVFPTPAPLSTAIKNVTGIVVALGGVIAYGEIKRREKIDNKQPQDALDQVLVRAYRVIVPETTAEAEKISAEQP